MENTYCKIPPADEYATTIENTQVTVCFSQNEKPELKEMIRSLLGPAYKERLRVST